MKTFLFFLSLCAPLWVAAQASDSMAVQQVDSLLRAARSFVKNYDLDKALELTQTAEKITLSDDIAMGPHSPLYATCCYVHGLILYYQGNYAASEKWHLEALGIREKVFGKEHIDYAESLQFLAVLNYEMGDYEKAEMLYLEVKDIFEVHLKNRTKRNYIYCLNNLAALYYEMGTYEKAEPLYLESIRIKENVYGKEHTEYALSLGNLALLYRKMGNYEKAEQLFLEEKKLLENASWQKRPEYASFLNKLANLYRDIGSYEKAEPLYWEALEIREKTLGKKHLEYALNLQSLANLYQEMGLYEKAVQFHLEAKSIKENILGKEHHAYVGSLSDLADVYFKMGNYEKAEPLYREAMSIKENIFGKVHPLNNHTFIKMATLYWKTGNYESTMQFLTEVTALNRTLLSNSTHHLTEQELNKYLNLFTRSQNLVLSFAQEHEKKEMAPACYDNALFYKGFLLNATSRLNRLAKTSPQMWELHTQLNSCQRRLAAQYALPISKREGVAELEEKANAIEKQLAHAVAGYAEESKQVNWSEVQTALKPGEAAVEFVRFFYHNPDPTDSVLYATLLLRPDFAEPQFIPLFEEKTLTDMLLQGSEKQAEQMNDLYRNPALYSLVWKPLEQALSSAKTVYFSTDGLLHRLNLRAIATPDGHILADRYRLIRVNSTRQLVIPPSTQSVANDALVYGGIQYDMDADAIQKANISYQQLTLGSNQGELDFHNTDSTQRINYRASGEGGTWDYLPFTEVEAGLLQHDLQEVGTSVQVLSGYAATEESFKAIGHPSPRILHLATHGFFFPDPKKAVEGRGWKVEGEEPVFKISDHPMIRSGLLLAGANYAWKSGQPLQSGMEDGILTAYEISQMDLSNTELAVLSACETGLGDISGNEGVYGLQRAFKIAGTRYLIMSLWQVPDFQTKELMTTFYHHWLKDGKSVPDAFQITQQEMREKYKDPYLWAGFVLVE